MRTPSERHHKPEHPDAYRHLRAVAMGLVRRGMNYADAAREVGFTREAVREWSDDRAGLLRPKAFLGAPRTLTDDEVEALDDLLEGREEWRLKEVEALIVARFAKAPSRAPVMRMLWFLGYEAQGRRWVRGPERVPFRVQRELARKKEVEAMRERISAIAAHMDATGFSIDEIVGLLEECGAKGPSGRPIGRADVTRILRARAKRRIASI